MWNFFFPWRRDMRPLSAYWQSLCVALLWGSVAGLAILVFMPDAAGLFLLALYSIPSNSMLPVPHEPAILYFAKYYHPVWLAVAGTLGSAVAAFADYDLVGRAMNHPKIRGARDTRMYRLAVRWLMAQPFLTIVVFAATPLPVYVVRVLAPAQGYPIRRYIAALMVGRFPRFLVLAWFGYIVPVPNWILALIVLATVGMVVLSLLGNEDERADAIELFPAELDMAPVALEPAAQPTAGAQMPRAE